MSDFDYRVTNKLALQQGFDGEVLAVDSWSYNGGTQNPYLKVPFGPFLVSMEHAPGQINPLNVLWFEDNDFSAVAWWLQYGSAIGGGPTPAIVKTIVINPTDKIQQTMVATKSYIGVLSHGAIVTVKAIGFVAHPPSSLVLGQNINVMPW